MTAQPGRCSSSAEGVRIRWYDDTAGNPSAYLPLVQLVLLGLVLLDQVVKDLLQPVRICPQGGDDILDGPLHQNAIDHAEALAITRQRFQGFKNKSACG